MELHLITLIDGFWDSPQSNVTNILSNQFFLTNTTKTVSRSVLPKIIAKKCERTPAVAVWIKGLSPRHQLTPPGKSYCSKVQPLAMRNVYQTTSIVQLILKMVDENLQ